MKYLIPVLFLVACRQQQPVYVQPQQDYQTLAQPDGTQVVIVRDNNGSEFFMNYLIFQSLMNAGGINSCRGYYHQHYSEPWFQQQQNSYRHTTTINNYYSNKSNPDNNSVNKTNSNGFSVQQKQVEKTQSSGFSNKEVPKTQSSGFNRTFFDSKTTAPNPTQTRSSGFGNSTTSKSSSGTTFKSSSRGFSKH